MRCLYTKRNLGITGKGYYFMRNGYFSEEQGQFVISNPILARPWINYLGNRSLSAFVSHNAGGLLWFLEPYTRRISRYHYTAAPADRPGFYVYIRDMVSGKVWNPHFAPSCIDLDSFACTHEPGITSFSAEKDGLKVCLDYCIHPEDNIMLWNISLKNVTDRTLEIQAASYLEFGLLEFTRETMGWCYLKNQFSLRWDQELEAIRYDYHVFEAPDSPAMAFGCNGGVMVYDCSRDAFLGVNGDYRQPQTLTPGNDLTNSELPEGGHACAALGVNSRLEPGETKEFSYYFVLADNNENVDKLLDKYGHREVAGTVPEQVRNFWRDRFDILQVNSSELMLDRFVNVWNPYNAMTALRHARIISTDHMGTDGHRFRDTTQDALAVANIDPEFAMEQMKFVLAEQKTDGSGCMAFFPHTQRKTTEVPHRSDNSVWQVYTIKNLIAETGRIAILDEDIPFRDGGSGTVYTHLIRGLKHIFANRGRNGLPVMFHADWNDGLALFGDERAESVMLAMQLVYSCREFIELAEVQAREQDVEWCQTVISELTEILNSDIVWDGCWYKRLLLSDGRFIGSSANKQGRIYLNPQSWSVISGVAPPERAKLVMHSVAELLDTDCGIRILAPPFKGFPEPDDPPKGANPGIGENGGIFCHANTWAIIAECLLSNAARAFKYYKQLLPESVIAKHGENHYEREPYVYVSSLIGPDSSNFGKGGISWLTGTASWMYIAVTQYILGLKPMLTGLKIEPVISEQMKQIRVSRIFRGHKLDIQIENNSADNGISLKINGREYPPGITLSEEEITNN